MNRLLGRVLWLAFLASSSGSVSSETLQEYAAKCDAAVGFTVPDFMCDAGTEVPTTNHANGKCDRPNRLNKECDPGSRFQVLTSNNDAYVVAHCRKKGNQPGDGKYGDIAAIQYNRKTGATCFYQALATHLDGNVKAPSKGESGFWLSPADTAAIKCVACHDNGPLIRSPYLTQLKTGPNAMPGAGVSSFNSDQPYFFIGDHFASWKVYKVEIAGNTCNFCHRMGVSNQTNGGNGTALDLGIRATAESEPAKNPHSPTSPIWMLINQTYFNADRAKEAQAIRDCALKFNQTPLPNEPSCSITEYTGAPAPVPFFSALRHNSNFLQSTRSAEGADATYDLVLVQGAKLSHYGLAADRQDATWQKVGELYDATRPPGGAAGASPPTPVAVSVAHSGSGAPDNLDAVARLRPAANKKERTGADHLAQFHYDSAAKTWHGPIPITVAGKPVEGVTGDPALIRSNLGPSGRLELLVPQGDRIAHYWRAGDTPNSPWQQGPDVYDGALVAGENAVSAPSIPQGLALLQGRSDDKGNLEVVARLAPRIQLTHHDTAYLAHFHLDPTAMKWQGPFKINADGAPIAGVTGNPAFLQSTPGSGGGFELVVPQGNKVIHYARDNATGLSWRKVAEVFDSTVTSRGNLAVVPPLPIGVTMIQDRSKGSNNLEALIRMTSRTSIDSPLDHLSYFYFDSMQKKWNGPVQFHLDGQLATVSGR